MVIKPRSNDMIIIKKSIVYILFFCLSLIMLMVATFKPVGLDYDSGNYQNALLSFQNGVNDISEPVFIFFAWLDSLIFNNNIHGLFFLYALISVPINMVVIYKYSKSPLLSLIVYTCLYFILHDLTQIRVGAAAAVFLLAIPDLISGNKKKYIIKVFIASMFHFSSVILISLIFLSNKKVNAKFFVFSPMVVLLFTLFTSNTYQILIDIFNFLPAPIGPKAANYVLNLQLLGKFDNVNVFSKITLCTLFFFTLYFYSLLKSDKPTEFDIIYFKIMSVMLTVFYFLSSVPVLASRSFELLGVSLIFSLPALSLRFKQKRLVGLVIIMWCFVYLYVVNLKLLNFEMLGTL
ncbi:putative membrane protein [Candidatus Erwinia dacicola]|uniref:Membrane protein n=3 Tax=Candidatus Erwinia dacicola TaxID=252393 RepID=A0A328TKS1_9GAMM|nr:putative membrane protein [Candidatus Erwinia dacicola]